MRVFVTGATGFIGRAVVSAAAGGGHQVVALVRPAADVTDLEWPADVSVVRGDLRQPGAWTVDAAAAEVVVHLAAAASGDLPAQISGTVIATENLLDAIDAGTVRRFVHISTFSVYDFDALPAGAILDELAPLERAPERRDAYTATKLAQERLVRSRCAAGDIPIVVIRPGVVFGPGKVWNFGAAMRLGRNSLVFSPRALVPVTYVQNCAAAIVRAIDGPDAPGRAINIVDDELPTYAQFIRGWRRHGAPAGRTVPVPWIAIAGVGRTLEAVNQRLLGGRARLPEFLSYRRQQVRWKPFDYSNAAARQALGWTPTVGLDEAMRDTLAGVAS